jgi:hypothetical protein
VNDRDRALQVLRLRNDARRARRLAAQVTVADDLQLYQQLAAEWDQQADALEAAANDDSAAAHRSGRNRAKRR